MRKIYLSVNIALMAILLGSCNSKSTSNNEAPNLDNIEMEETYSSGEVNVYVEESVIPIFEDVAMVFESEYPKAKLNTVASSENKIVNLLAQDSIRLAIMPRKLSEKEVNYFKNRVTPKQTPFAKDAIVFIANKDFQDTLVKYEDILSYLKNPQDAKYQLVFEDVNSALFNRLMHDAEITDIPEQVYFRESAKDVLELLTRHKNLIGVIGLNWLVQPNDSVAKLMKEVHSLAVYNQDEDDYFKANQSTIADGTYPLVRELYIIDLQGKSGLGTGFASFAAGDKGQRVILKSGLLPVKIPTRQINIKEN